MPWSSVPDGAALYARSKDLARLRAQADALVRDSHRLHDESVELHRRITEVAAIVRALRWPILLAG